MERGGAEDTFRLMRAIRSLAYNRELQPLVADRLERAESIIRSYLLANGLTATRVGYYQLEMDEKGDIELSRLPADDWKQLRLPQLDSSLQPAKVDNSNGRTRATYPE